MLQRLLTWRREHDAGALVVEVQKTLHASGDSGGSVEAHRERILSAVAELVPALPVRRALETSHANVPA